MTRSHRSDLARAGSRKSSETNSPEAGAAPNTSHSTVCKDVPAAIMRDAFSSTADIAGSVITSAKNP